MISINTVIIVFFVPCKANKIGSLSKSSNFQCQMRLSIYEYNYSSSVKNAVKNLKLIIG